MKKKYTKSMYYLAVATLAACNSGGGTASTSSNPSSTLVAEKGGIYHGGAAATQLNYFNSGAYNKLKSLMAASGSSYAPVGWSSTTNAIAPINCWNYSASLVVSPEGNSNSIGVSQSASAFEQSLGTDVSISASFSIFSASNDLSYSSTKATDSNSTSAYSSEITRYKVMFAVTGLNGFGQRLLTTDPRHFNSICGDQVALTIPVKLQSGVNIVYTSSDNSASTKLADQLSAGVPFAKISTSITSSTSSSNSTSRIRINQFTFGDPATFTPLSDAGQTALASCLTSGSATDCTIFLTEFNNNYATGVTQAEQHFNQNNGTDWAGIYATDNSKYQDSLMLEDNIQHLTADQQNQLLNINSQTPLKEYLATIKTSIAVLADIDMVRSIFSTVNDVNPTQPWSSDSTISYGTVMHDYTNAIQGAYDSLHTKLGKCIYAKESADVITNCGSLEASATVNQLVLNSLNPMTKEFKKAESNALNATIDYMIYDVKMSPSADIGTPQKLIVLPNDTTSTSVTLASLAYLNDGVSGSFYLFSQPQVGGSDIISELQKLGNPNPISNQLFTGFGGATNVTSSVSQNGISNNSNCLLYFINSEGCTWSFTSNGLALSIKDNAGQRLFKTLYPYK